MSKVAFRALWCFVLVLPWDVFLYVPVLGSIPRIVGLAASAVGVLYIAVRRRVRPLSWLHVFAILFVLWAGVTTLWSIDPEATETRFLTYLQLLVFLWLLSEIAWSPPRQRALFQAYVLGASVAALVTIHNYLSGVPIAGSHMGLDAARFTAFNQDPNELGLTLALGLPMAWYVSLSQPHRRSAWLWRLYLPLGITGILLTASRGSVIAALVGLSIIPWTLGRLHLRTRAALYALAAGSLVLASNVVPQAALERIATTRADIEAGSFGHRSVIWRAGFDVAREHPLVGVGAGAFGTAVAPTLEHRESASHDVPLGILVEDGIVGLSLFVAMVAAATTSLCLFPPLQRRFSIVLLLTLLVGSLSIEWDHRKQFWFVVGVLGAQVAPRPGRKSVSLAGELDREHVKSRF